MVHSEPIFAEFVSIFSNKLCVIFAFKSPIFYIHVRDAEIFHLSCRGKAKEGNFLSSRSRGGGVRGLREKIFEKRMQMVHSEPIFAEFVSIPTKKLCVIFAFKAPISMMREIFFLSHGGGVLTIVFVFFFFLKKRLQMIHSESIHSRLLVGIFFFFFF